jgi:hypothetical protein
VLVRFPLHVILSVEAAFPSTIVPEKSEKMPTNVRRFNIATTAERSPGFVYFSGMGAAATMGRTIGNFDEGADPFVPNHFLDSVAPVIVTDTREV